MYKWRSGQSEGCSCVIDMEVPAKVREALVVEGVQPLNRWLCRALGVRRGQVCGERTG